MARKLSRMQQKAMFAKLNRNPQKTFLLQDTIGAFGKRIPRTVMKLKAANIIEARKKFGEKRVGFLLIKVKDIRASVRPRVVEQK